MTQMWPRHKAGAVPCNERGGFGRVALAMRKGGLADLQNHHNSTPFLCCPGLPCFFVSFALSIWVSGFVIPILPEP